jgi:hypothetical protein
MNIFRHNDLLKIWDKRALKRYFNQRIDDYFLAFGIDDKDDRKVFKKVCPKIMFDYLYCKKLF